MIFRLLLSFAFVLVPMSCIAQDKEPKPSTEQIEQWIEQLANKSPKRKFTTPADKLTKDELASLAVVRHAYRQLTKHFRQALPLLVDHQSDRRYSYPSEHPSSGVYQIQSVGEACENLIRGKVLINNPVFVDDRDIAVWVEMPVDKEWFDRVKGMSLFEMQLDSMDWLLKHEPLPRVSEGQWTKRITQYKQSRDEFAKRGIAREEEFGPVID